MATKQRLTLRVPAGATAEWRNREFVGPVKVTEKR